MLKRIVVAAIALVVLAAALPAQAQYHRQQTFQPVRYQNPGRVDLFDQYPWITYGVRNTQGVVTQIRRLGDEAQADIARNREYRDYQNSRQSYQQGYRTSQGRYDRNSRYGDIIPVRRIPLGPYVWGRRYPFDSCGYSWNRGGCRDYQAIRNFIAAGIVNADTRRLLNEMQMEREQDREAILDRIDQDYATEAQEAVVGNDPAQAAVPRSAPQESAKATGAVIVNMTSCKAHVNGEPIPVNGHTTVADRSKQIFVEVDNPGCNKYLDPIADGVIALKCH